MSNKVKELLSIDLSYKEGNYVITRPCAPSSVPNELRMLQKRGCEAKALFGKKVVGAVVRRPNDKLGHWYTIGGTQVD